MSGRIESHQVISYNPATSAELGRVPLATPEDYEEAIQKACRTFERWRLCPAPQRGEIVREIGDELRRAKADLGKLVTQESGKILAEGEGEVQEMIDVAGFAAGLSRQLYGLTMPSERPGHRMYEQWHPLGVVGVITAFNFPVAVWSWNALIAIACGDTIVWKPSLKTPLAALEVHRICERVLARHGWSGVLNLVIGTDDTVGRRLVEDHRVPLISATGSVRMGKQIAPVVGEVAQAKCCLTTSHEITDLGARCGSQFQADALMKPRKAAERIDDVCVGQRTDERKRDRARHADFQVAHGITPILKRG